MPKFILLSIIFSLIFSVSILAENKTAYITGAIVAESTREKIEFANVVLLNADSTYHSGCATDNLGNFYFKDIPHNKYLIKISYIGYLPKLIACSVNRATHDLGEIYLSENASILNEVIVSATQRKYKTENGITITNVSNTDLKTIGSAYDVLENVPGLSVIDEKINVFGKGEPIIYINNRKVLDKKELEKYRSTDIKNIELIHNPSAKYDANGRSVLIVNLNKAVDDNMAFQATSQYKQGKYANTSNLMSFSLKKNRLNIFSSYMYSHQKNNIENETNYTIHSDKTWHQEVNIPLTFQTNFHSLTAGIDFDLSDKHILGMQYQGNFSLLKNNFDSYQNLFANQDIVDKISTLTSLRNESKQHLLNFFYDGNIAENLKINITGDYLHNTAPSKQFTEELDINSEQRLLDINSESKFKMIALKSVVSYNVKPNGTIELGLDYNKINGEGYYMDENNYLEKNRYTTTESKNGAFISYNDQLGNTSYNLGLRYEYSKYLTDENSSNSTDYKNHNFFPYFSISQKMNNVSMSMSFSKKIRRPSFSELNSNNLYLNKYLIQKGDPKLKAEDIYLINYLLGYKLLNFNMNYTYIKNPISTDFMQEGNNSPESLMRFTNYPKYQKIDAFSTLNYSFGSWKFAYSVGFTQPFFKANYLNVNKNRNKPNLYLSLNNDFKLVGDFITSLNFSMNTDNDQYIVRSDGQKRLDLRFRKSFFNSRLTTSMFIRDVFNWEKERNMIYVNSFNYDEKRKRNNRYIAITLQFNLSASKSKYRGNNIATDELKRF